MSWYLQGLQITIGLMLYCFQSQVDIAVFDLGFNISLNSRLIVFSTNELSYFLDIKMTC